MPLPERLSRCPLVDHDGARLRPTGVRDEGFDGHRSEIAKEVESCRVERERTEEAGGASPSSARFKTC